MAKIIAICGSPACGKTTAGLKIAQEAYFSTKTPILYISPDLNIPSLSYIFPRSKNSDLFSLGVALDKTTITDEDILLQTVNSPSMKNFGFLGYKLCENRYSYAKPTDDKIRDMLRACENIAPNIFIDCASCFDDPVSAIALRRADYIIQFISPDLRSIGYYSSYEERYDNISHKCIKVLNLTDNDIFLPIQEVKAHFKNVNFVIPYSQALKQQTITGTLTEKLNDNKLTAVCKDIARMVALG